MKMTRSFINGLLVCGVAFATASSLSAQNKEEVVKVVRIVGAARYAPPGGTMQELTKGAILKAGSVIQSGIAPSSYVDIVIGGANAPLPALGAVDYRRFNPNARYAARSAQSVLRLYANTVLGIDKLVANETGAGTVSETELDLRKGHIMGNVKKLSAGSEFRIRYPKGVAAIRGSGVFDMTVEEIRELKPGEQPGAVPLGISFSMYSGSGVISYTDANGTVVTQVVAPMQSWNSGAPTITGAFPPGLVGQTTTFVNQTQITGAQPIVGAPAGSVPDHTQQTPTAGTP